MTKLPENWDEDEYWNKKLDRRSTTGRFMGTYESALNFKLCLLLLQHEMPVALQFLGNEREVAPSRVSFEIEVGEAVNCIYSEVSPASYSKETFKRYQTRRKLGWIQAKF